MDKNSSRNILVIRLSAMGDVAMTVPVLKGLTEKYPELRITVLTRAFFKPLFLPLHNVTVYSAEVRGKHKGLVGLWKLYRELKGMNLEAVADLHNVLRSNILRRYFTLSDIPFVQIDKGRKEKKALTSVHGKVFKPLLTTHQRYARVFERLGYPIDLAAVEPLPKQRLTDEIRTILGGDYKRWVGIAPFAAFAGKEYPLNLMEEVIQKLENDKNIRILLFGGGKDERKRLMQWENRFENAISLAGKLDFSAELSVISNLDLMVSMDSGNAHLAANYGIPVLTLWGLTHPFAGFYPFKQNPANALLADREKYPGIPTSVYGNKMPKGYEKAMETIPPQLVVEKIQELLAIT